MGSSSIQSPLQAKEPSMTTKTKPPIRSTVPRSWALTPPWTTEERQQRIEAMGQRIEGYVQFMCQAGNLNTASDEAREKAVTAFYEQMVVVERQLRRIHDDFQLE
jgi:hypothetical protein